MRFARNVIIGLGVVWSSAAHADLFLVLDKSGAGIELSQKFGQTVEGTLSKDGLSVSVGGKDYPAATFGLSKDGCFEVGIQKGIERGLFGDPQFRGAGENEGRSVRFSTTVSAEIAAGVEICPKVGKPFQLDPLRDPGSKEPPAQRMIVFGVDKVRWKAGEQVKARLTAYCLDIGRATPGRAIRFKISPSLKLTGDAFTKLVSMSQMSDRQLQMCIWAAFPKELWKTEAWKFRWLLETPTDDEAIANYATFLRQRLAAVADQMKADCPLAPELLSASFENGELATLLKCFEKHGNLGKEACIYSG